MTDKEKKTIELLNKYTDRNFPCDSCKYCSERPNVNYSIKILLNLIEKQQKELEPIKKLNIPVETLVSEFNRLEDLEDNTEMLKSELEKKDKIIDEMVDNIFLMNGNKGCTKKEKIEYFTNKVEEDK